MRSRAAGVGQSVSADKESLASMCGSDIRRAEECFRNPVTQALQFASDNCVGWSAIALLNGKHPWDVFQKHESRSRPVDNPADLRPKVALVPVALLCAGLAEGLAREARSEEIHCPTPASAVEGGDIVPERRWIQPPFFHARCQDGGGIGVPFNITDGAISVAEGELDPEFESCATGT